MADSFVRISTIDPDVQLQKLGAALEAGNIKQALRLRSRFMRHPADSYPREIQNKFQILTRQLSELQDWQNFATNPKRLELCEKMESLKTLAEIHPEEKAVAIKELQDTWHQLGPSDSNEGQQLWQRFKQAGDTAFSVCADYFKHKKESRDKNLQERVNICENLKQYAAQTDWDNADWKATSQILKKAKSEWKRHNEVPHQQRKEIHDIFDQALLTIQTRLMEEQARNHQLKRDLILEVDDLLATNKKIATLVQAVKCIQNTWKKVGITDRGTDQKLWIEFRKICDDVFAKRDEDKADKEILKAQTSQKAQQRKIDKENARRNQREILEELKRKSGLCEQLEKGAPVDAIISQWNSTTSLPEKLAEITTTRFEQARSGKIQYANADEVVETCVKMEILAHISSPESSQGIRMKLQVERLDRQLSKGIKEDRSVTQQLVELQTQWYCLGAIQDRENELRKRFVKAESAVKQSS